MHTLYTYTNILVHVSLSLSLACTCVYVYVSLLYIYSCVWAEAREEGQKMNWLGRVSISVYLCLLFGLVLFINFSFLFANTLFHL